MEYLLSLKGLGASFLNLMKELFFSENSRLWWAWILCSYPLAGSLVGHHELKKSGQRTTPKELFKFIFPSKIYKSASFRNDVIIVFSLYAFYAMILYFFTVLEAKYIMFKLVGFFDSGLGNFPGLAAHKNTFSNNIGIHLIFTFLVILFYDFGFTMLHYAFHKMPFFWQFHRVHHSAEHLTPLTVARFHLVEFTLQKIFEGLAIGFIFGLFYFFVPENIDLYKVFGLSIFGIVFSSIGVFRHSHIWISYGPLSYIFCSPAMHQIHHSKEARHRDVNLSQVFSFWDWMLGTLYVPKEKENFALGLSKEENWNDADPKKYFTVHWRR